MEREVGDNEIEGAVGEGERLFVRANGGADREVAAGCPGQAGHLRRKVALNHAADGPVPYQPRAHRAPVAAEVQDMGKAAADVAEPFLKAQRGFQEQEIALGKSRRRPIPVCAHGAPVEGGRAGDFGIAHGRYMARARAFKKSHVEGGWARHVPPVSLR